MSDFNNEVVNVNEEEVMDQTPETDVYTYDEEPTRESSGLLGTVLAFGVGALSTYIGVKVAPKIKAKLEERKAIRQAQKEAKARVKEEMKAADHAEDDADEIVVDAPKKKKK